jgi:EAL domain-containing protein (putative c-di-GMP-specific phosphodiesterase class I)/GGDEF domain-containing protein
MTSDTAEVALGAGSEALAQLVRAAGGQTAGSAAEVRLVDARAGCQGVAAEEASAAAARAALLAIVTDEAGALAAYDAGATHVCMGELNAATLATALRFAGRYARRMRGTGRMRRAGEAGDGAAECFLTTLDPTAPVTIAVVAMTRFDTVNAAYGREAGDQLLREAAGRISAMLPPEAVIQRDNGARFIIALAEGDQAAGARIAAIEAALGRRFALGREEASLGARIGVAHRIAGEAADALILRTREALALAVTGEGAGIRVSPQPDASTGIDLAADLHRAMDRGEIDILFQPQVSVSSGAIVGVEALARWEHPVHGVLGASTLFAAAERAGLGLPLSEHIQLLALQRAGAWTDGLATMRVAVNVTAADLARSDFVAHFLGLVARAAIDPARVTAEVTESGFVTDLALAAERLDQLRAAGLRVAIDDFGTGYSSLAYLKALPLDYLKIDRSLTQDIAGGLRARVVVRGIIAIAVGLGLRTIAEGVEDVIERDLLAQEGCDLYQGFLCAGPLDERALARLVERVNA